MALKMAGLFWLEAASRYKRRKPQTGDALPGGSAEATARFDGRPTEQGGPHRVMGLFFGCVDYGLWWYLQGS